MHQLVVKMPGNHQNGHQRISTGVCYGCGLEAKGFDYEVALAQIKETP